MIVYTDGGARPNPGHAAFGIFYTIDGSHVHGYGHYLGAERTNNYAEYAGVVEALRQIWADAQEYPERTYELRSDSELIVRQLTGRYQVASASLKPMHDEAMELIAEIPHITIVHVRRELNALADRLATSAIRQKSDVTFSWDVVSSSSSSSSEDRDRVTTKKLKTTV